MYSSVLPAHSGYRRFPRRKPVQCGGTEPRGESEKTGPFRLGNEGFFFSTFLLIGPALSRVMFFRGQMQDYLGVSDSNLLRMTGVRFKGIFEVPAQFHLKNLGSRWIPVFLSVLIHWKKSVLLLPAGSSGGRFTVLHAMPERVSANSGRKDFYLSPNAYIQMQIQE